MAVGECPECNGVISEHALICPHCGLPKEKAEELLEAKERERAEREAKWKEYDAEMMAEARRYCREGGSGLGLHPPDDPVRRTLQPYIDRIDEEYVKSREGYYDDEGNWHAPTNQVRSRREREDEKKRKEEAEWEADRVRKWNLKVYKKMALFLLFSLSVLGFYGIFSGHDEASVLLVSLIFLVIGCGLFNGKLNTPPSQ